MRIHPHVSNEYKKNKCKLVITLICALLEDRHHNPVRETFKKYLG